MMELNVDASLGREETHFLNYEDEKVVKFIIYPRNDLLITKPLLVQVAFPAQYSTKGGAKARLIDKVDGVLVRIFEGKLKEDNFIDIPWMENVKYPVSVWFYAVRGLLKAPLQHLWTSAPTLLTEFRLVQDHKPVFSTSEANSLVLTCGVGRSQGRRNYMEDMDFIFESIRISERGRYVSAYGVLDGHGGKDCAQYAADEMGMNIAKHLRSGKSCAGALFHAIIDTDAEYLSSVDVGGNSNAGCTANILLYDRIDNRFYVANTGDTRCVLCRSSTSSDSGKAYELSVDRKATDSEEIARIAQAGGFVAKGRVMGSLAVSRAIGDAELKLKMASIVSKSASSVTTTTSSSSSEKDLTNNEGAGFVPEYAQDENNSNRLITTASTTTGGPGSSLGLAFSKTRGNLVIADPELSTFSPGAEDEFLIVATDGLWDVMSSQQAVDFARELLFREGVLVKKVDCGGLFGAVRPTDIPSRLSAVAKQIAEHAVTNLCSMDNVTVMLILISGGDKMPPPSSMPSPEPYATGVKAVYGAAAPAAATGLAAMDSEADLVDTILRESEGSSPSSSTSSSTSGEPTTQFFNPHNKKNNTSNVADAYANVSNRAVAKGLVENNTSGWGYPTTHVDSVASGAAGGHLDGSHAGFSRAAGGKKDVDPEDDLMAFLTDDSNF